MQPRRSFRHQSHGIDGYDDQNHEIDDSTCFEEVVALEMIQSTNVYCEGQGLWIDFVVV